MSTQALLVEILLSGFFAVACFKARAQSSQDMRITPRALFALTDRLERLRRSRWQWFAMVLLLVVIRKEQGAAIVAEFTVLAQFLLFLAMPSISTTSRVLALRR